MDVHDSRNNHARRPVNRRKSKPLPAITAINKLWKSKLTIAKVMGVAALAYCCSRPKTQEFLRDKIVVTWSDHIKNKFEEKFTAMLKPPVEVVDKSGIDEKSRTVTSIPKDIGLTPKGIYPAKDKSPEKSVPPKVTEEPVESRPDLSNKFLTNLEEARVYQLSDAVSAKVSITDIGLPEDQELWYKGKYSNGEAVPLVFKNGTFYPVLQVSRQLITAGDYIFVGAPTEEDLIRFKSWEERQQGWKSGKLSRDELTAELLLPEVQAVFRDKALKRYAPPTKDNKKPSMYLSDLEIQAEAAGLVEHIFLPVKYFKKIIEDKAGNISFPKSVFSFSEDKLTKIILIDGGRTPDGRGSKPNYNCGKDVTIHFSAGPDLPTINVMIISSYFPTTLTEQGVLVATGDTVYYTSAAGKERYVSGRFDDGNKYSLYDKSAGLEFARSYKKNSEGEIQYWDKLADGTVLRFTFPHSEAVFHQYEELSSEQATSFVQFLRLERFKKQLCSPDEPFRISSSFSHVLDPAEKASTDGRQGMHSDFWELSLEAMLFTRINSDTNKAGNYSQEFRELAVKLIHEFSELSPKEQQQKLALLAERQQEVKDIQDQWLKIFQEFDPKFKLSDLLVHPQHIAIWNKEGRQLIANNYEGSSANQIK